MSGRVPGYPPSMPVPRGTSARVGTVRDRAGQRCFPDLICPFGVVSPKMLSTSRTMTLPGGQTSRDRLVLLGFGTEKAPGIAVAGAPGHGVRWLVAA